MSTSTNESVVFEGLSSLLRTHVLTPIVQYLGGKGIQVNVDELANVLKLPSQNTSGAVPMISNGPPSLGLPGFNTMTSTGSRRGKRSEPSQPAPDHERCQYIFTRGRNRGKQCPNRVEVGMPFCSNCKTKKAAKQQLESGGIAMQTSNLQFRQGGMPQVPGLNSTMGTNLATPPVQQQKLMGQPIGNGLYREGTHGLVLKPGSKPEEYICVGVMTNLQTNTIDPLTPDKIEICRQYNISYVDPNKNNPPTTNSVKQSTTTSALPALPNVHMQQPQTQMPAVPSVPNTQTQVPAVQNSQVQGVTLASVSQANPSQSSNSSIGTLPGVPAITDMKNMGEPEDDE